MAIADLEIPASVGLSSAVGRSSASLRLCLPGILIFSFVMVGAAQCAAQDVAKTARQERAQKESKQKKSKHVYTGQDLKRAQILTPEDRAQVEAKKNQPALLSAEESTEAVDAQSLPPDVSLGDVARRFRKQKQLQKLQQSAEFHLPLGARLTEASGEAAASASFRSCSTKICSLPAAGEALTFRTPKGLPVRSSSRVACAAACRSGKAFRTGCAGGA